MNGAFERLIPAVTRYGGTAARLMGDAVLALFGAPTAHEDDPYRAILAALDMLADLRPYQQRIRSRLLQAGLKPTPTDFEIRVGINTGLVVVGRVGSGQSGEYTAMGDAVNLAARMEQTAEPGMIQFTSDVHRLVAPVIQTQPLGRIKVKGKNEAVQTYQVHRLKANQGGLRSARGLDAPLIGRNDEITVLSQALEDTLRGAGQIVNVIGEAGLGKSRLIHELKQMAAQESAVQWFEAVSLSFEATQPYGLLQRLFRRVCGCVQDDTPDEVREKILRFIGELPEDLQQTVSPVLGSLFSIELSSDPVSLSGEDLKRELFTSMRALWTHLASLAPVILVLDDLHWADAASAELVRHLFEITERMPIYFLCVFRPNRGSPAWQVKQFAEQDYAYRYKEVMLSPLSRQESGSLVESLLPISDFPAQARDLILKKAEGNPFFVEEIVRELIESETVAPSGVGQGWQLTGDIRSIEVPDSLEALLVARIDRLDDTARHTLQLASVIGRNFYYRVLALIAASVDQLDDHLRTLQQVGLIREATRLPELEYIFRHVLTQEAAYNTILIKQRRHFHQRTGEIMEELFGDRLDEHAALLAYHFLQAEDYDRAFSYLVQAGQNAARLYANTEAIDQYSQALALDLHRPLGPGERISLHRDRGLAYETLGQFDRARPDLEQVLDTAQAVGRAHQEWRALLDLGMLWASRDYQRSGEYFRNALDKARQLGEPAALAPSLNRLGNWLVNAERPQESIQYHQEARTIFEDFEDRPGRAATLDFLGMASLLSSDSVSSKTYYRDAIHLFQDMGDQVGLVSSMTAMAECGPTYQTRYGFASLTLNEALVEAEHALQIAQDIGWRAAEAFASWSLAQIYGVLGDLKRGIPTAERALAIAKDIEHIQWMSGAHKTLGDLHTDLMNWPTAIAHSGAAVQLALQVGSQNMHFVASGSLAGAQLDGGDLQAAWKTLAVLKPDTAMISIGQRVCWGARAELALAEGDLTLGLEIVEELRMTAAQLPSDGVISVLWYHWARLLLAADQPQEAEVLLRQAAQSTEHFNERTLSWRIQRELGQSLHRQSKDSEAQAAIQTGKSIVSAIAATIEDDKLRESFSSRANTHLSFK